PRALTNSGVPSAPVAKYGVEPRASTLAGSSRSSGTPTRPNPPATAAGVGRRDGAPRMTSTAAPQSHPTRTARTESNDTGEARKRVTVMPAINVQPARRQRRDSQGAADVATAATTAMPTIVG